jgi:protein TonB
MTQLQYSTGSFRGSRAEIQTSPQQRLFGIAFAVTMEAAIIYALLVALGYAPAPPVQRGPLEVFNVRLPEKIEVPLPPPQTFEPPQVVTVVPPEVVLTYTPPAPPTTISLPPPQPVPQTPPRAVQPPTPPVVFTPARSIASTHTIPDYPFVSRRLREQGTLRLKLTIDEKGIVTLATVVNSSGFQRLDEAAVNWVKSHWRYTPATQGTTPVPSMADAIVEFRLQ